MVNPKLGIVTVFYNSPEVLKDFFYSVSIQNYTNYQVYVVDNSSNDESLKCAKILALEYKINLIIINNNGANVGVAAGNNQGIESALKDKCDYILLANNDLIFEDKTVFSSIITIAINDNEKIISPAILNYPEKRSWYVGGDFDTYRALAPHHHVGENYNQIKSTLPDHCSYAPTCFILIDASVFDIVGLMDEKYFAYYDDTDFMYRANMHSIHVRIAKDTIVYHKVSVSTGGGYSPFGSYHLTRNRIYFAKKSFTFPKRELSIIYTIATRLTLPLFRTESRSIYKYLLKGICDGLRM